MKIQIRTNTGDTSTEIITTALEKVEFAESLPKKFTNGVDIDLAIVSYDSGTIREINTLDELIEELGKFGL